MPTQREVSPGEPKPYFDVEVWVDGADKWACLRSYKTERGAIQKLRRGPIIPRRIVRVHPDGRREVVQ